MQLLSPNYLKATPLALTDDAIMQCANAAIEAAKRNGTTTVYVDLDLEHPPRRDDPTRERARMLCIQAGWCTDIDGRTGHLILTPPTAEARGNRYA